MSLVYIVFGRFERLSFDRRERYVRPIAEKILAITKMLEESITAILARKKRDIRLSKSLSAQIRVGIFTISSAVVIVGSAIALFFSVMRKVFFNLLIGWKGLQLGSLSTMFEKFIGMAEQLTGALHIPTSFVIYLFYPLVLIYKVAELFNMNAFYSLLTVTCEGAKSPIELFIDSAVLGASILFIKSNYNFLWAMTFQEMNKLSVVKYWIEGERIYSRKFVMAVIALSLTATNHHAAVFSIVCKLWSIFREQPRHARSVEGLCGHRRLSEPGAVVSECYVCAGLVADRPHAIQHSGDRVSEGIREGLLLRGQRYFRASTVVLPQPR